MESAAPQEPLLAISEAAPDFLQNDDGYHHQQTEGTCSDWLGHPIGDDRMDVMGGWKCSYCVLGAFGLACLAYFGILLNLVVYLVQVCGLTNAEAASTVTNISGTISVCSFIGAFVGDAYMGHLWASLIFQLLDLLFYASVTVVVLIISKGPATVAARTCLLVSLYLLAVAGGPILPNSTVLGADQLATVEEKEKYFRLLGILTCTGELFSVTLVTFIDNSGMWGWGFGLCTASVLAAIVLFATMLRYFRQYKAARNPFLRVVQVPVAAWRKRSLSLHDNSNFLLHESQGKLSSVPVFDKQPRASSLSFLDKAAVLDSTEASNHSISWHMCTVTQVEEFRSLVRVVPVGIAIALVSTMLAQISTLFEEQANLMNRQVTTWLAIPAASLNIFSIGSAIFTGIITATCGSRLGGLVRRGGKQVHGIRATNSLQLQSAALFCGMVVMVIAALVESHRLCAAQEGTLLSVLWLVPQTVLAGVACYLVIVGGADFFYSEVPEGLRAVSSSVFYMFQGAGSYLSSLLVALVTAITTQGGQPGWIASDLNQGHVDYFYWCLASCLAFTLGIFLIYTHNYAKRAHIPDKTDSELP